MGESVKDILETFDLQQKSDEVVSQIHDATDAGISRYRAAPAIVITVIHENTDKNWFEVCRELGVDTDITLESRNELVKSGVLDISIDVPSELCRGKPSELLAAVENSHSDMIFDGSAPSSWISASTYIDEYVNRRQTPIEVVAEQYRSNVGTIIKKSEKLVNTDTFDRVYATDDIDGPLGRLLARRRHTTGTLRHSLTESSDAVSERLAALERESNYEVKSDQFGQKTFYWTEDPAESG